MIELNLSASNHEQEKIKAYLQNNVKSSCRGLNFL